MRKILITLLCLVGIQAMAQEKMRITLNNGSTLDFHVANVEEMSYYVQENRNIVGEWLTIESTGSVSYHNFSEAGTVTQGVFYSTYGLNSYNGTYTFDNTTISLYLLGSAIFANIDVWNNDNFTTSIGDMFLRVLDVYTMKDTDDPIAIGNEGDKILWVNSYNLSIEDNKIKPVREGSGYAIVKDAATGKYKAYRVDVTASPVAPTDWIIYLKKSKEEIESYFGEQHQYNETNNTFSYTTYNSQIQLLVFTFDQETNMVTKVMVYFYDKDKMQSYLDYLAEKYNAIRNTETRITYIDSEESRDATVEISVSMTDLLNCITYTDKSK